MISSLIRIGTIRKDRIRERYISPFLKSNNNPRLKRFQKKIPDIVSNLLPAHDYRRDFHVADHKEHWTMRIVSVVFAGWFAPFALNEMTSQGRWPIVAVLETPSPVPIPFVWNDFKKLVLFLQNGSLKVEIPKIRHQSESESGSAVFCRLAGGPDDSLKMILLVRSFDL